VRVSDFHFDLPEELIAQHPPAERGSSRMLVLDRTTGAVTDEVFRSLPGLLRAGDLLILNDSRVLPARLFATRGGLGTQAGSPAPSGVVEVLLTEEVEENLWRVLVKPAKKVGETLYFNQTKGPGLKPLSAESAYRGLKPAATPGEGPDAAPWEGPDAAPWEKPDAAPGEKPDATPGGQPADVPAGVSQVLTAEVVEAGEFGERTLRFAAVEDFYERVGRIGHMPLPPYIRREQTGRSRGKELEKPGAKAPSHPGEGFVGLKPHAPSVDSLSRGEAEVGMKPHAPSVGSLSRGEAEVEAEDRERYQTVYGREVGSAAAPTAGLHFTPEILAELEVRGVEVRYLTLHVGLGTFQPVRVDRLEDIRLHAERYMLPAATAEALNRALAEGRRVVAVGTTTARTLEHIAAEAAGAVAESCKEDVPGAKAHPDSGLVLPGLKSRPILRPAVSSTSRAVHFEAHSGSTSIFLAPGHRFRVVSGLLTNFHLPESTLVMLVSAFAGRERVMGAYEHAIREGYRFYSYGDCMLVV
jgi:S-adenosylmethionine:tRNA-ribosyltransferase-isomerase (queuine synthetase)